jgi:hypothetical protein
MTEIERGEEVAREQLLEYKQVRYHEVGRGELIARVGFRGSRPQGLLLDGAGTPRHKEYESEH